MKWLLAAVVLSVFYPLHSVANYIAEKSTGTAIRFDSSLNMWIIGVSGEFQADCILPQYSYGRALNTEDSVFMSCHELTQIVSESSFLKPTRYNVSLPCYSFFQTLSVVSMVESQLLCGDPYEDNRLVWHHKSVMVKPSIFNQTTSFRILYIKKLHNNFAVHVKVFSYEPHTLSKLPNILQGNMIIENYCVKQGFRTVKHGLLHVYNYYESLSSCNVLCGDAFIRKPWLATSAPLVTITNHLNNISNQSVQEREVRCEPVNAPFDTVLSTMNFEVSSEFQMAHNLPDEFFIEVNALAVEIEAWFKDRGLIVTCVIDVPGSRFSDITLQQATNKLVAQVDSDEFEVITNKRPIRRLLQYFEELDVSVIVIFSTPLSPAHISSYMNQMNDELLTRRASSPYITGIKNLHLETMTHVPSKAQPPPDSSFNLIFVIGLGIFIVALVVVIFVTAFKK